MRVALYCRVSTTDQTCENQLRDLREYCQARGWENPQEFIDHGVSGSTDRRPALDRLMTAVRARKLDVVVVAAFDRFARSTRHLVTALDEMQHVGVQFISLRESIDTGSPLGRAVFTIVAAIGELERSLIVERIHSGLRRARANGVRLGQPEVAVDVVKARKIIEKTGSVRAAARALRVAPGTIRRALAHAGQCSPRRATRQANGHLDDAGAHPCLLGPGMVVASPRVVSCVSVRRSLVWPSCDGRPPRDVVPSRGWLAVSLAAPRRPQHHR
jgi:DNA invertase Pin-like site-specific DNA recombinase